MLSRKFIKIFIFTGTFLGIILLFDPVMKRVVQSAANFFLDDVTVKVESFETSFLYLRSRAKLNVQASGETHAKVRELELDLNFRGFKPFIDVNLSDSEINVAKSFVEAREAKEKKTSDGPPLFLLSFLGDVKVSNIDFFYSDGTHSVLATLLSMDLDFPEGKGSLNGISVQLPEEDSQLLRVKNLTLDFNPKGFRRTGPTELKIHADDFRIELAKKSIEALKSLMTVSPDETDIENKSSPLNELSSIEVDSFKLLDRDRKVEGTIDYFGANIKDGTATLRGLSTEWSRSKNQIFELEKASVKFDPEKLRSTEKPDLRIILTNFNITAGPDLIRTFTSKSSKSEQSSPELPVTISRLLLGNGRVNFPQYPGLDGKPFLTLNDIFGNLYNLTLTPGTPLAKFNVNATVGGNSRAMLNGKLNLASSPPEVSMDYRLFDLDMRRLNEEFRKKIPITFKEGEFDLLGEVIQRDGRTMGYVKPYLDGAAYLGNQKEFRGPKHFFFEIGATVANWFLENDSSDTVATKIPFVIEDGKINFDITEAIVRSLEHGLLETVRVKARTDQYELREAQQEDVTR